MENPISEKSFSIMNGYNGSKESKDKMNINAKNGVDTIIIGNITDYTMATNRQQCEDKTLRAYVGTINFYAQKGNAIYIPGEHDFRIYSSLREIIDYYRTSDASSPAKVLYDCKYIMDLISDAKTEIPKYVPIYEEMFLLGLVSTTKPNYYKALTRRLELEDKEKKMALYESEYSKNGFLYLIKSFVALGKQPIYAIRKNNNGEYILISHAKPEGVVISKETAKTLSQSENIPTIEKVAKMKSTLLQTSTVGNTHRILKAKIQSILDNYLIDPKNPNRSTPTNPEDR